MKCPKCQAAFTTTESHCAQCGVDLLAAMEARAAVPAAPRAERTRRSDSRGPSVRILGAGAAFFILLFLWRQLSPDVGPPPWGAVEDLRYHFTVIPPSGWAVDHTARPRGGSAEVLRLAKGATNITVLVGPSELYESAVSEDGASALLQSEFNGTQPRLESIDAIAVDGLKAARLSASGGRVVMPSSSAGPLHPSLESLEFRGLLVLVQGAGRTYLIKVSSDRGELERQAKPLEEFLASFRVTKRPWLSF